jgi:hypothetical protein
MRLLIYAMQSSGASALALLLAQKPACCALVDIWTMYVAPSLPGPQDVVAKVVVTTAFPLRLHQERFRPDRTILMLRHPVANYRSLATKNYRHHCGFIEEKFALLDQVFVRGTLYDAIFHYEDLVFDPLGTLRALTDLGWSCDPEFLVLRRKPPDIVVFNEEVFPVLKERLQYGSGSYHGGPITSAFARLSDLSDGECPVLEWCPHVVDHYTRLIRERPDRWGGEGALR